MIGFCCEVELFKGWRVSKTLSFTWYIEIEYRHGAPCAPEGEGHGEGEGGVK